MPKQKISKEEFIWIWNNSKSIDDVVEKTGYTRGSVCAKSSQLRKEGYPVKRWKKPILRKNRYAEVASKLSKKFLLQHKEKSISWLAKHTGHDPKTITRYAKKHGVEFAGAKKTCTFLYSGKLKSYIDGLLLSDGSLMIRPSGLRKSYHQVSVNHDWLEEIKSKFENNGIRCRWGKPRVAKTNTQYSLHTYTYLTWLDWSTRWYPGNQKRIPRDLKISPSLLRNVFLGDGTMRNVMEFCLEGFPSNDVKWFAEQLSVMFPTTQLVKVRSGLRLQILAQDRNSVIDYIGAVPPSFQYKIVRSVRYP